jgi:hypothetical protein
MSYSNSDNYNNDFRSVNNDQDNTYNSMSYSNSDNFNIDFRSVNNGQHNTHNS